MTHRKVHPSEALIELSTEELNGRDFPWWELFQQFLRKLENACLINSGFNNTHDFPLW
jgi:hypothetical protein